MEPQNTSKLLRRAGKSSTSYLDLDIGEVLSHVNEIASDRLYDINNSVLKKRQHGGNGKSAEIKRKKPKTDRGKLFCKDKPNGALRTPIQCNAKAEYRIEYLKKAGETFIQDGACSKVAPKLSKCQECKSALQEPRLSPSKTLCRFDAFRRLRYTKNGNLATAGFLDPNKDVTQKDLSLWLPQHLSSSISPDMESSLFLLLHVSSQFYRLLEQEREAITINMAETKIVAWKRMVQGVREICDVCKTALFNYHWVCHKCGFVVCIDCYKSRKNGLIKKWLLCTNGRGHNQETLMLTQIVPADCLETLGLKLQQFQDTYSIPLSTTANYEKDACPLTPTKSKELFPDVPHSWLCGGRLLHLHKSNHPGNFKLFQDQWRRGQPVLVSDVTKHLDQDLWHPESFARDFGDIRNVLVDCMTGRSVHSHLMREFWEGFKHPERRLKDEDGNPMLLKLKDWPPGDDFAEMLPSRYMNLMSALPMSEYTSRSGPLNLVSCLPDCFVPPDLGPKMYSAYGSALYPSKGSTNLHLDVSDAVNVLVYVGISNDSLDHSRVVYRVISEACADRQTRRVQKKTRLPGALWHIYAANDAAKIRALLSRVAAERGRTLESHQDPIHDQTWYLDNKLRGRLLTEYGVEGYTIVQCLGDAIFIPAGAPHQVQNLNNCIKVAEDFVSPENISHCFHLMQEFRKLSDVHLNHEDKLQVKNIIYHAVKDALSVLPLE